VIPLFKSCFSVGGRSILTLDEPDLDAPEGGPDSIFSLAQEGELKQITLVEDCLVGYLKAYNRCKQLGLALNFGLRLSMRNSFLPDDKNSDHKVIVFAKNKNVCVRLNKIYSAAFSAEGFLTYSKLKELWSGQDLILAMPFYDSFIFNNTTSFSSCLPNYASFTNPIFFIEQNGLPFDGLIKDKVEDFCKRDKLKIFQAKSIYYKNREDVSAFQAYKILCARASFKKSSLTKPNLEHFGSNEFCWQSFMESRNG
jgi:DNA polymerase III alpha subunit